jgi:mono/diheme cytochrome c family protein
MPAYKDVLSDKEILASLSFIKSTWSRKIKLQHDKINEMNK